MLEGSEFIVNIVRGVSGEGSSITEDFQEKHSPRRQEKSPQRRRKSGCDSIWLSFSMRIVWNERNVKL